MARSSIRRRIGTNLGATISDLPASFTFRPLVVIDIHEKVAADPGYHLQ